MTDHAARVAGPLGQKHRLDIVAIEVEVECRRRGVDPAGQGLPLRVGLRLPVLAARVPVATTGLFDQRVHQQDALGRRARHDQPPHPLEVALRLLLIVVVPSRRQRLEIGVATPPRVAHDTAGVPGALGEQNRFDRVAIQVVVELKQRSLRKRGRRDRPHHDLHRQRRQEQAE